jgi:hypothetical protein
VGNHITCLGWDLETGALGQFQNMEFIILKIIPPAATEIFLF